MANRDELEARLGTLIESVEKKALDNLDTYEDEFALDVAAMLQQGLRNEIHAKQLVQLESIAVSLDGLGRLIRAMLPDPNKPPNEGGEG